MNNNSNLLHEFLNKGYELEKLKPYEDFLIECFEKDYSNYPTQKHHILPKSMNNNKYADEIIELSLLDHFEAHRILAFCFDNGSEERRKNLSACKYIKVHVKRFMVKNNYDVPQEFLDFWDLAHKIMKDFNKGENNLFFGKKHTEKTKQIIREKRALQVFSEETIEKHRQRLRSLPVCKSGPENPYYGLTFDERFGEERSKEIRNKLKWVASERRKNKPLPDGIFECNIIINDIQKWFYRICPKCNDKIYYNGERQDKPGQQIRAAQTNNIHCEKCRNERKQKPLNIPERTRSYSISNYIRILDNRTNIIYDSKIDTRRQLKLRECEFEKLLQDGILKIYENKSTHKNRIKFKQP